MRLFRIAPEKFCADLSGTGARLFGGRWTPRGVPAIYTSESPALAALEVLVHLPVDIAPERLALVEVEVPDSPKVETVGLAGLDKGWDAYPYRSPTVRIGEGWARKNKALALKVPSAILPYGKGWNFILNPLHPEFGRVKVIGQESFSFERRPLRR